MTLSHGIRRTLAPAFVPALILALVLIPFVADAHAAGDDSAPADDPVLKALVDELGRSMTL